MKLKEYDVLNDIKSCNIKDCLTKSDLIENEDYILTAERSAVKIREKSHGGSNGNKKEYTLTPKAFKLCLIRAKNSKRYAKYYIMLEDIFYYYNDYQNLYKEKILSMKDVKIDKLTNQVGDLTNQVKELLGSNRIQSYNDSRLNKKYANEYNIIKREFNANPVQLYNSLKENVKKEYKIEKERIKADRRIRNKRELYRNLEKIKFNRNTISIERMTLNELLDRIESIANSKFEDYNFITTS